MTAATDWNAIAGAVISSAVTGVVTLLVARESRKKTPGEAADTLASAFSKLVDQLQEENGRHLAQISTMREEAHRLRNQLTKLRGFAEAVFKHVKVLEDCIKAMGGTCPDRPVIPPLEG